MEAYTGAVVIVVIGVSQWKWFVSETAFID